MRFGQMLAIWLDYLGMSSEAFAALSGKHPAYLASLKRGRKGESGTDKPNSESQRMIFQGLEKAVLKKEKSKIAMTHNRFWSGPQTATHQAMIQQVIAQQNAAQQAASANAPDTTAATATSTAAPAIDFERALLDGRLAFRGRIPTHEERERLRRIIIATLE